jgi:hypothetical protein
MAERTSDIRFECEAAAEPIGELNERILEAGKRAGGGYLDAHEQTLMASVDLQDGSVRRARSAESRRSPTLRPGCAQLRRGRRRRGPQGARVGAAGADALVCSRPRAPLASAGRAPG